MRRRWRGACATSGREEEDRTGKGGGSIGPHTREHASMRLGKQAVGIVDNACGRLGPPRGDRTHRERASPIARAVDNRSPNILVVEM